MTQIEASTSSEAAKDSSGLEGGANFISITELLHQSPDEALAMALAENRRLREYNERLEEIAGLDALNRIQNASGIVKAIAGVYSWPVVGPGFGRRLRALTQFIIKPSETSAV